MKNKSVLIFEKLKFLLENLDETLSFHKRKTVFGFEVVLSSPIINETITKEEIVLLNSKLKNFPKTSHLPFYGLNLACPDKNIENYSIKVIKEAIILAKSIGISVGVCHTTFSPLMPKKTTVKWIKRFLKNKELLENFAKKHNFVIAWENTYEQNLELFNKMFEQNNDTKFCVDIGHLNCFSHFSLEDLLRKFKSNIIHAHIHDNGGNEDSHGFLGTGNIDFNNVISLLINSNVQNFVFELSKENFLKSETKIYELFEI